ncbi:hypothetical protein BaRGS_00014893 [Batillaria attramentaria]|uniref:Sugar phosphate transporter domain-containing protein n=1 Tax=Batillaria attramentaria TaxID=370345 RepID=A0ABD0L3Z1_9CAEN
MAAGQKKKRQTPKRDLRLLKSTIKPKAEEVKKSICSFAYLVTAVKTLSLVLFYYFFSITLTFYNQRFIHQYQLPLSFTMAHLVFKFMAAGLIRWLLECKTGEQRVLLEWKDYAKRVAPPGIVSALDIGLSNWSFDFITVSLYTMSKSSAVIFILGFALLFRLEKCSTQFNMEGFVMVMLASILSGLRWTLAQIVLQKHEIGLKLSSTELVFRFNDIDVLAKNLGLVLLGAVLAFFLEFSEFLLLCMTSSLTLSISGIFKELCVLYLAVYVNGDKISAVNGIGLIVCLAGISLHVILKAVYARQDREEEMVRALNHPEERIEMLTRDGDANTGGEDDDEEELFSVDRDR